MKQRDAEIRRHEQSHAAHAGHHGGRPVLQYRRGPDGKMYAVGGRVSINVTAAASPEATIEKMETLIRASVAPADPSHNDRAVAALARRMKTQAESQLRAQEMRDQRREFREKRLSGEIATSVFRQDLPDNATRAQALYAYGQSSETLNRHQELISSPEPVELFA